MPEKLKKYFKGDSVIWAVILALSIFSVLAVLSSTSSLAYKYKGGNVFYYMLRHVFFLFLGYIIIYFTHLVPFKYFSRLSVFVLLASIPLLGLTLLFGTNINDASRWLEVPGLGLSFQTSDLAKIALIMYIARVLSLKQENIGSFKEAFLPIVIPVLIICALIAPANLSTAALLFGVSMILMYVGRIKFTYLFLLGASLILGMVLLISVAIKYDWGGRAETWQHRWESFTDSSDNDGNYQSEQSKIAIATSGIIGKGPGNSVQRNFLPHPYSDFIYAIIVEEWGLIGGLLVLFLYLYLLFRAGVIVRNSTYTFQAFLVFGLTILLVSQAMVNMCVAVGLIPVTGQPLPMISMGGTSILFTSAALGMILSVSRSTMEAQEEKAIEEKEVENAAE